MFYRIRTARRGVTLMATAVLLSVAAAVILSIIAVTLSQTRAASVRTASRAVDSLIADTRTNLETLMAIDPLFFLASVHPSERARVCPDTTVVEPGEVWDCGFAWTYQDPASGLDPASIEIVPPSVESGQMQVTYQATVGPRTEAQQVVYSSDSFARYALLTSGPMTLSNLPSGASVTGEMYAGGTITRGSVNINAAIVETEGVIPSGLSAGTSVYGPVPNPASSPPIKDIRDVAEAPVGFGPLLADIPMLAATSCAPGAPVAVGVYQSKACLADGRQLISTAGGTITLPTGTVAYLLAVTGPNQVAVYTRASAYVNLQSVDAGDHPGLLSNWTLQGTVKAPVSGVFTSDVDVFVGLCDRVSGFSACRQWTTGQAGMQLSGMGLTVIAGTYSRPADVYMSGPITVGSGSLSVVGTGSVFVPFWSAPLLGSVTIQANMIGLGHATALSPVRGVDHTDGWAFISRGGLTVSGTMAGPALDLVFPRFAGVTISGNDRYWWSPPPYAPSPTAAWFAVSSAPITPAW